MKDLKKKFRKEIDECTWGLLDKNLERGAVFLVSSKLKLEDVAFAIANDQVQTVSNWLASKELERLSIKESEKYKEQKFYYLIIQPYVVVQVKKD